MHIDKLTELFNSDLKYFYFAKRKTEQVLPKIEKSADSEELSKILQDYSTNNSKHIERLKEVFNTLGIEPDVKESKGIEGIIEEAEDILEKQEIMDKSVFHSAMIATVQRILHYDIAASGTLRTYADTLGKKGVAADLNNILIDEKEADSSLSEFAEKNANPEAAEPV